MNAEEAVEILDKVLAQVGEHFDTVQIHVTWMTEDGSGCALAAHRGTGNWYARQHSAREFIEMNQHRDLAQEIKKVSDETD